MMEPRWSRTFASAFVFVGGTSKVDIHVSTEEIADGKLEVRLVWGHTGAETWHWVEYDRDRDRLFFKVSLLRDPPNEEELEEVRNYLRLFAPWALESM